MKIKEMIQQSQQYWDDVSKRIDETEATQGRAAADEYYRQQHEGFTSVEAGKARVS